MRLPFGVKTASAIVQLIADRYCFLLRWHFVIGRPENNFPTAPTSMHFISWRNHIGLPLDNDLQFRLSHFAEFCNQPLAEHVKYFYVKRTSTAIAKVTNRPSLEVPPPMAAWYMTWRSERKYRFAITTNWSCQGWRALERMKTSPFVPHVGGINLVYTFLLEFPALTYFKDQEAALVILNGHMTLDALEKIIITSKKHSPSN